MRLLLILALLLQSQMSQSREFTQEEADRYNYLFSSANEIVEPFLYIQDTTRTPVDKDRLDLAIKMYDEAIAINPDSWASMWFKGKAFQAMGNFGSAYFSFKQAYRINPDNPDVVNEYILECINTEKHQEALEANLIGAQNFQDHVGIQANLALVFILLGQQDKAIQQGNIALKLNRKDEVTKNLIEIAKKIKSGKQIQPSSIFELSNEM